MKYISGLIAGFTLLLAGCSSPQVRYHTLVNPEPVTSSVPPADFVIELLPVGVPAQLDSQQIVIRQSDSRVVVLENDRWLSPLGDELQTALSTGITQRLNTIDVAGLARDNNKPVVRIVLQIRRFDSWPGKAVSLDADWSLSSQSAQKRIRLVCKTHLSQPLAGEDVQLFSAWQRLVDKLASQIGHTATDWFATNSEVCHRE
ncbi:PqiC family protein [Phytobacter sp. V91]|uniref:PqiC family protein n=1 Tax=Phytobacter sp. V91 TaxID=3369425 RepID=UPI003F5F651B